MDTTKRNSENKSIAFNNMNTTGLIPLESVLQDIYRLVPQNGEGFTQDDMLESAASAAHHLYNYKFCEHAICVHEVINHKVTLPNYQEINAVLWRKCIDEGSSIGDIVETVDLSFCDDEAVQLTAKQIYKSISYANGIGWCYMDNVHSLETLIHLLDDETDLDLGSSTTDNAYATTTTYDSSTGDVEDVTTTIRDRDNIGGEAGSHRYTYSVTGNLMTTSTNSGHVLIVYKRVLRDEDGCLLIPNIATVNEAIKAYVIMEMHIRDEIMHRQGSESKVDRWTNRWERLSAAAVNEMMMPDLPEWVNIVSETNRIAKHNDNPDRHYGYHYGGQDYYLGM